MNHDFISAESLRYSYISRNLPHLFDVDKPLFITFRLNMTLPEQMMIEYNRRRELWYAQFQAMDENQKGKALQSRDGKFFTWFDELLASNNDVPKFLAREDVTNIIIESLRYHDGKRYQLWAYCIMPNHVHVLIKPLKQGNGLIYPPQHICYTWKKYSAYRINQVMQFKGALWQRGSYDHLVRDENEMLRVIDYIIMNPVKAKLVDNWVEWKGSYLNPMLEECSRV